MLAEVQIRLHKYSEALHSLEQALDEYGILIHGCVDKNRIREATEVLEKYHSLCINVPDSLQEAMRRVERKLMQLLTEILSCEFIKHLEEARSLSLRVKPIGFFGGDRKLFRRLLHTIENQILHNQTRNLTELTIGVAEILVKRTNIPSSLLEELRFTVTTGLTLPLTVVNLLQEQVNATQSPCTYPEFSQMAFRLFVFLALLLGTSAFFKCVEHASCDRPFTLILTIAFGTVLFLVFLLVITSIFS